MIEVLKLGGVESEDPRFLASLGAGLGARPRACVIVHGGGKRISGVCERMGLPVEFLNGLRRTPPEVAEVAAWVLGAGVNVAVCRALRGAGVDAVSVCGADGLLRAVPHSDAARLGRVGDVVEVDRSRLVRLVAAGFTPVIAPVARGLGDDDGLFNVNADHAAVAIAVALRSHALRFVSGVPGVLDAGGAVIEVIGADGGRALIEAGVVSDGMVPKVESALRARAGGVADVRICGVEDGTGTRIA